MCVCVHPAGSAVALPRTCVHMDRTFCTCSWNTTCGWRILSQKWAHAHGGRHTYDVICTSFSRAGKKVAGRLPEWQMWSASGSRHFIRCRSWRWVCESVIGSVWVVHAWHLARVRWRSVLGPGGMDRWLACLLGRMVREGGGGSSSSSWRWKGPQTCWICKTGAKWSEQLMVECPLLNPAAIPHHHPPTLLRLLPQPNCLGPQKVWSERRGKDDLVVWSVGRSVAFCSNFLNTEVTQCCGSTCSAW